MRPYIYTVMCHVVSNRNIEEIINPQDPNPQGIPSPSKFQYIIARASVLPLHQQAQPFGRPDTQAL
jgi:hypothetical protein